jgi:hypothetical protein
MTAVSAWGVIGYGYKSPLIFIYRSGKSYTLTQVDYLSQVLEPYIRPILEAFALIIYELGIDPLFIEDGNPAYGHKSHTNCY